jgi:CDP-paratose 2-epimerase
MRRKDSQTPQGLVLVTGGAGFIGTNLTHRLLGQGIHVRVLDSLARPGVEDNLRWLRATHPTGLDVIIGDIRDRGVLETAMRGVQHVFHFAAQVAVTTSLVDPRSDFDVNAAGTLNLLETARVQRHPPGVTYASTNKVYGALDGLDVRIQGARYLPADAGVRQRGIDERQALEFHSPYGCSKGAAEQYVLDYARTFGMRNCVLRMSCIYGPHQHGNTDQGWVAHFLRAARAGDPIIIYGDGRQVRDLLFIDDFTAALMRVLALSGSLRGRAFNIGGGADNTVSLLELIDMIEALLGRNVRLRHEAWREADQKYYVSDTTRFCQATGWVPRVRVASGLRALASWLERSAGEEDLPRRVAPEPVFDSARPGLSS